MVAHYLWGDYTLTNGNAQEYLTLSSEQFVPDIKGGIGRFIFTPKVAKVILGKEAEYSITFSPTLLFTGDAGAPVCTIRKSAPSTGVYVG